MHVAFLANDSSRQELYVQQFATDGAPRALGERRLVSKNGALAVRWSRDGKELFYLGMDSRLYSVPLRLEREPIFGEAKALFSIPLDARASLPTSFGFDVSLDGRRFLVPVVSPSRASLVAIQNWQSLLR